jgi:hypothetical protein
MAEEARLDEELQRQVLQRRIEEKRIAIQQGKEAIIPTPTPGAIPTLEEVQQQSSSENTPSMYSEILHSLDSWKMPMSTNVLRFTARGVKEYNSFMNQLSAHFKAHRNYFGKDDQQKVDYAVLYLDTRCNDAWSQYTNRFTTDRNWEEFQEFCLKQVNTPRNLKQDAVRTYMTALQQEHQSVREISIYLESLEEQLPYKVTEEMKKHHLWAKVLPRIQAEANYYPQEADSYDAYVDLLQMVENAMPGRKAFLQKSRGKRKTKWNDQSPPPADTDAQDNQSDNRKRRRDFFQSLKPTITCNYCNKVGHYESQCFSKKRKELKN